MESESVPEDVSTSTCSGSEDTTERKKSIPYGVEKLN